MKCRSFCCASINEEGYVTLPDETLICAGRIWEFPTSRAMNLVLDGRDSLPPVCTIDIEDRNITLTVRVRGLTGADHLAQPHLTFITSSAILVVNP